MVKVWGDKGEVNGKGKIVKYTEDIVTQLKI